MHELIEHALKEDLGSGDVTSAAVVPEEAAARARIVQKAPGVISGLRVAESVFRVVDPELRWHAHVHDGEWREEGARGGGGGPGALPCWRASAWRSTSSATCREWPRSPRATCAPSPGTNAKILDTRKTTPGLRVLEKSGGGWTAAAHNHRIGLFDAMLDEGEPPRRSADGVGQATRRALAASAGRP